MVKLIGKFVYRGHVYFEAVSPDLLRSALTVLEIKQPTVQ